MSLAEVAGIGGDDRGRGVAGDTNVSHAISSKYTLCPRGFNHVDTFRIYEALMAGVIVVTCDTSSATQLRKRMTSPRCTRLTRIPSQAASLLCHVTTISLHSSAPIIRSPGTAFAHALVSVLCAAPHAAVPAVWRKMSGRTLPSCCRCLWRVCCRRCRVT